MMNVIGIISSASNMRDGDNPPYGAEDFRAVYPQFFREDGAPLVPPAVLELYLQFAHSCVLKSRYQDAWKMCMGLFVAHFLTLYLQTATDEALGAPDARAVMAAGQTRGLVTAKSVGGASVSYDFSTALQDLNGWAAWKLTSYGVQFVTQAKTLTMGGMYIP